MTLKVNKINTIEEYLVKDEYDYAYFFVDAQNGVLSIVSNYGSMGYRWEAPGNDFKKFLAELNTDYLMNKLGKKAFNLDGTIKNMKNWIISSRREEKCTQEEARYVWDYVINEIKQYNIQDEGFFWGIINSNLEHIVKVDEDYFEGIEVDSEWSDYDKYFMNHIWKAFVKQLLNEKQTE